MRSICRHTFFLTLLISSANAQPTRPTPPQPCNIPLQQVMRPDLVLGEYDNVELRRACRLGNDAAAKANRQANAKCDAERHETYETLKSLYYAAVRALQEQEQNAKEYHDKQMSTDPCTGGPVHTSGGYARAC